MVYKKRKVKRGRRKGAKRRATSKGLKTYSYKRSGNATGDTGKVNLGDLTTHTSDGTWLNPRYEIANNGITSVVLAMDYLRNHRLDQMAGLNDFIEFNEPPTSGTARQLYGLYRINGIRLKLIPNLTALDQTAGTNRPTQIVVQSVKDPANLLNDVSTEARVNQFQTKSSRKLIWDGKSSLSYYFKPRVLNTVGAVQYSAPPVEAPVSYGNAIGSSKTSPWIRMDRSGVTVNHLGDELFFKSTALFNTQITNNFRIEKTFYVSFKQVM